MLFGFTYLQCTRHPDLIYNLSVCSVFTYLGSWARNSTEPFIALAKGRQLTAYFLYDKTLCKASKPSISYIQILRPPAILAASINLYIYPLFNTKLKFNVSI